MLVKPLSAMALMRARRREASTSQTNPAAAKRPTAAVFRGAAITLPVIAVLAALLASADPIFNQGLNSLLNVFHIQNLGEYIFRGIYILTGAYLIAGIFLHSMVFSRDEHLVGLEKPWLNRFLGGTESGMLLGSVNLLFAAFVAVQARYFFGGQANIQAAGFTYAEYARRGFGELVAVAVISLLLILGLSTVAKRETRSQRRLFNGLVAGLVALVLVILVSAFQRLLLYEGAYGFTRLRTYTHVFIPWLGLLLGATALLELVRRPRNFALAVLLVTIGFGASLTLLNVDAFVARENITRATQGQELDLGYLAQLSDDAVPTLVSQFHNQSLPAAVRERMGAALACREAQAVDTPAEGHWQSYNISRATGQHLLAELQDELKAFPTQRSQTGEPLVRVSGTQVNGTLESCWSNHSND
jgi:FtsH-binding integral membrane protein